MKRTLSLFLASLMLASALISCSTPADDPADTTDSAETTLPVETEPAETGRADAKDNLPADLKLNGMKVHMHSFSSEDWDIIGKNEESGDMIFDAVYYRTRSVADRLDVKFEWTDSPHEKWQDFSTSLESTILAGDDVWQIVFAQGNSTIQSNRDHLFMDMADSKYLDLEQPWWWSDAMYEVSFDGQMRRYLIGDICLTNFLRAGAVYFNKNIYEDALGNPDDLYKLVIDGGWTLDKMGELATAAYRDVNGNGTLDAEDIYGFHFGKKDYIVHMEYALDVERFHRDERGYPVMEYDLERAQLAVEKMNKLLYQTKGCAFNSQTHITAADFAARKTFFFGNQLLAAVNAALRDMEDDYGIIPFPKLDETQADYMNLLFNSSTVATVPITCKQHENVGAVIEAMCAESYRSVVETFYETALKMKYSRDSYSGQCIDIIRNVTRKNLMYEYNGQLGYPAMLITNCVAANNNDIASSIASVIPAANEKIKQKIETLEKDKAANAQ
ncbi:MAG: hypothetical protein E7662_03640 [Ruminococcaceae bacterium]|nr:hypothetical protein [Oscillospiraceae bacterium]